MLKTLANKNNLALKQLAPAMVSNNGHTLKRHISSSLHKEYVENQVNSYWDYIRSLEQDFKKTRNCTNFNDGQLLNINYDFVFNKLQGNEKDSEQLFKVCQSKESSSGPSKRAFSARLSPRRSQKKMKIGIIGADAGITGMSVAKVLKENGGNDFEVVSAYGRNPEAARKMCENYKEFSNDFTLHRDEFSVYEDSTLQSDVGNSAIYIPMIPSSGKRAAILEAVSQGITVLCEKPLCTNAEEVRALRAAYEDILVSNPNAGKIMVGLHSLTHPSYSVFKSTLSRLSRTQKISRINCIGSWPKTPSADPRMFCPNGGGPFIDMAIYFVSIVNDLFPGIAFSSSMKFNQFSSEKVEGGEVETELDVELIADNGIRVRHWSSMEAHRDGKYWL